MNDLFIMELYNHVKLYVNDSTNSLEKYAKEKQLKDIRCFLAIFPNGDKEYLLVKDRTPIYSSQLFESIAVHIDILVLKEELK